MTAPTSTTSTAESVLMTEQGGGPRWPSPRPAPGQSRQDWLDEVARLRAQHDTMALEAARRFGGTPEAPLPMASVTYRDIPVDGGTVSARVYTPPGSGPFAAVLFLHGGGLWMGGGATAYEINDATCRHTAGELGAVVLNLDYRLAPEHRYPVQLEDGYAALQHVRDHATDLAVDAARVSLLGISSGGLLAAGITHLTRERGAPQVDRLILMAPLLDLSTVPDLADHPGRGALLKQLRSYYVDDPSVDLTTSTLAPLLAPDLAGLPPTVVVTGTRDALTPHGSGYVQRLRAAGVEAVELSYPMGHGDADAALARRVTAEMLEATRRLRP